MCAAKGMARRLASFDQYKALVLGMTNGSQVDFTSARALNDMIHDVQDNGRHAFVVCVRPAVRKFLGRQGVIANLAEGR